MLHRIKLSKAEFYKDYTVVDVTADNLSKFGIYTNAQIKPLYTSMSKNISAYKTGYGVFAIRNETAEKIWVRLC